MNWYDLDEGQRIKDVYSKYSIKDFWDWWSGGDRKVMEVRIKDYKLIKETANKFKIPWSSSGVYVDNSIMLRNVIGFVRDKATLWCGINPRKKNWNQKGWKGYNSGDKGGSSDYNILSVEYIFIDIDRKIKITSANKKDLKECNILADNILERLKSVGWNKSYIKLCSGNGVQLIIQLDVPFILPNVEYNEINKIFIDNNEFDKLRNLIREGIGKDIIKFCKKINKDLEANVEVDKSCFNINRVGALPVTKNYKYNGFTWRGIVELANGVNEGLSDFVLSNITNITEYKNKNIFINRKGSYIQNRVKDFEFINHPLVKLMLENNLPYGEINNKLWFQLKCLVRDNKLDFNNEHLSKIRKILEQKYKGSFSTNLPLKKFNYEEDIINSFCINNLIPPIFTLWGKRTKKLDMKLENRNFWEDKNIYDTEKEIILNGNNILEDMNFIKSKLIKSDTNNCLIISSFTLAFIKKYGEKIAKYYADNIFYKHFSYN